MQTAVLSISELNRRARQILEGSFPLSWVAGEVSNLTRAASGHVYFSLKDANAQVRCVMFRSRAQVLPWRLENGQQVEAQVLVSLYEARGDFQLNVEAMRRAGLGQLFEAFARLKAKLDAEGLFADARKRALPVYPRTIGIVTSPQAAALRDVLTTLRRRAPHVPVIVYPTLVQGDQAAAGIAAAIEAANRRDECDVLIVARGGGSIEDLWAFNEETSARAIAGSRIPVISGVGHETDVTIADFAADLRAPTPTAAAELVSTGWFAAQEALKRQQVQLQTLMRRRIENRMQALDLLAHRLVSPQQRLQQMQQRTQLLQTRLQHAMQRALQGRHARLDRLGDAIGHLNPEATLARGYSIVRNAAGEIVRDSAQFKPGDAVHLRFDKGSASGRIESTSGIEE